MIPKGAEGVTSKEYYFETLINQIAGYIPRG